MENKANFTDQSKPIIETNGEIEKTKYHINMDININPKNDMTVIEFDNLMIKLDTLTRAYLNSKPYIK